MGYGFGVMFPVLMFGSVSGAHINPAMTIAQAVNGLFPWNEVLPYIVAQLLGALLGQLIVYITYYPHYKETEDAEAILAPSAPLTRTTRRPTTSSTRCSAPWCSSSALCCLSLAWGKQDYAAASIVVGFIVWGLVTSMGGPTGPGLNPARDLMPRLLHAILPIPHKGSSRWGEAWIRLWPRLSAPLSALGCSCSSSPADSLIDSYMQMASARFGRRPLSLNQVNAETTAPGTPAGPS